METPIGEVEAAWCKINKWKGKALYSKLDFTFPLL
jgi:hypothetical protein